MSIQDKIDQLNALLDAFDANKYGDDDIASPEDLFRKIFITHIYEIDGDRKVGTVDCGSAKIEPGPQAFYRLLWLAKPKQLDFSDMYKRNIFALVSPEGEFAAEVGFWKYEPAINFTAAPQHVRTESRVVYCGIPGSDNGQYPVTPALKAWIALLLRCLSRTWMIYSGNDFEV